MKNCATFSIGSWILVIVFLASISNAQSQDIFREMTQVKKELSDLRNRVDDLTNLVYGMRKALFESVRAPTQKAPEKRPPKEEAAVKQVESLSEEQLTKVICRAVGKFFVEADAALRMRDSSAAQAKMTEALATLTSTLHAYPRTHRTAKLLNIYDGLAWDTYVAVQQRDSVPGNEEFIRLLGKHKEKYRDTCPKE